MIKLLLEKGANPNEYYQYPQRLIHQVCRDNKSNILDMLLINGANTNSTYNNGITPLHCAAAFSIECVKSLLNSQAAVNAITKMGMTPLHIACAYGNIDIVKLLIQNGANINATAKVHFINFIFHLNSIIVLILIMVKLHF